MYLISGNYKVEVTKLSLSSPFYKVQSKEWRTKSESRTAD